MKANELRIGNLVFYHIVDKLDERKEWDEVSPIDIQDLANIEHDNEIGKTESEYNPIPLTEEWLLKSGFERSGDDLLFDINTMFFVSYNDDEFVHLKSNHLEIIASIKYVHELQNLYFALTNNELIIR
jgi:hypothetical protein